MAKKEVEGAREVEIPTKIPGGWEGGREGGVYNWRQSLGGGREGRRRKRNRGQSRPRMLINNEL